MITARAITPVILVGGQGKHAAFTEKFGRPRALFKRLAAHSPFQQTLFRALPFAPPVIVCHQKYEGFVRQQIEEINAPLGQIITEPMEKGSAAALALASFALREANPVMAVMPSYPMKLDVLRLEQDILDGALYADGRIVVLGARLKRVQKRYGYVLADVKQGERCHPVWAFVDRPNAPGAQLLRATPGALWSAGFILCRPRFYLDVLARLDQDTFKACERAFYAAEQTSGTLHAHSRSYEALQQRTFGRSVMEKLEQACVVEMRAALTPA